MGSVFVAATFATAVLALSPALVAAQEAEGAQARERRPRTTAITQVEQPDSSRPDSARTGTQAERRRPPATAAVDASSNDEQASNGQRSGAVRRPPSGGSSGGSSPGGSSSGSSEGGWDRAVPRRSDPNPPRHVYYPNYRYYDHYYDPWGYATFGLGYFYYSPWGYGPGYWGPSYYGYGSYGPYPSRGYDLGSIKLKVTPRDAEVFVDGYYAGTVDDFDGVFQALKLDSGGYKIEIRKPGFETLHFDVRVQPDRTITYRGEMKAIP